MEIPKSLISVLSELGIDIKDIKLMASADLDIQGHPQFSGCLLRQKN